MRWLLIAPLAVLTLIVAVSPAAADDRDRVSLSTRSALIGQQVTVIAEVYTPLGATAEVDPAASSWGSVEFVRLASATTRREDGVAIHRLELVVAGFMPGDIGFAPGINIVEGIDVTPRAMPRVGLSITPVLRASDPSELSPLPPPRAVAGAESPLLRPAIAAGVAAGLAAVAALAVLGVRAWRQRRLRPGLPLPVLPTPAPDFSGVEAVIDSDPASAYRTLAASVRAVLARRYGIPAAALTSGELARRMEAEGLDRWQARLVSGLLDECDAVVYVGYRPAAERRLFDLNMAREIVEASA